MGVFGVGSLRKEGKEGIPNERVIFLPNPFFLHEQIVLIGHARTCTRREIPYDKRYILKGNHHS